VLASEMLNQNFNIPENSISLYNSAESLVFEANMPDSALMLFRYIASNYPDLAPKAEYASAWILDQIMGVEDSSAIFAYSTVVKKYPETEFAEAAGRRLGAVTEEEKKRAPRSTIEEERQQQPENQPDTASQNTATLLLAPKTKVLGNFIYPEALLAQDLKGKVIFKIRLDMSGKVKEYEIIGPSGQYAIDSSATAALMETEFDVSELNLAQLNEYFQYNVQAS
jgi:TonB family protein